MSEPGQQRRIEPVNCPQLQTNCCVATGDTVQAAEAEIGEAIRFHIEGLKADGLPISAPTSIADYVET